MTTTTTSAGRADVADRTRTSDKRSREGKGVATGAHIALILWSLLVILPLLWTLLSSFKTTQEILGSPLSLPSKLRFDNYSSAWTTAGQSDAGSAWAHEPPMVPQLRIWGSAMPMAASRTTSQSAAAALAEIWACVARPPMRHCPSTFLSVKSARS